MPWRIEDATIERDANSVQGGPFKAFAVRDGRLITGQQQYSGRKVTQRAIETIGTWRRRPQVERDSPSRAISTNAANEPDRGPLRHASDTTAGSASFTAT